MRLEILDAGSSLDGVVCPFCGVVVLPPYDADVLEPWDPTPACGHVFLLAHDHGIVYLSGAVERRLAASGVLVVDAPGGGFLLEVSEGAAPTSDLSVIAGRVHGDGAVILALYAPAPSFEGTYVGVAKSLGNG